MKSMILVGLLAALAASATAGILAGGYSGSAAIGGIYSTGLLASGPVIPTSPVATSSISQQRIVNSIPIATRIVSPPLTSTYIGGGPVNLGNIGYGLSNTGGSSLNGYGGYGNGY